MPTDQRTPTRPKRLPLLSDEEVVIRWLSGTIGVAVVALLLVYNVHTAQTVADRIHEATLADGTSAERWCWSAAALCGAVLLATLYRVVSRTRRPSLLILWLAGAASVGWSFIVALAIASAFT